jgi:hypothetical protein
LRLPSDLSPYHCSCLGICCSIQFSGNKNSLVSLWTGFHPSSTCSLYSLHATSSIMDLKTSLRVRNASYALNPHRPPGDLAKLPSELQIKIFELVARGNEYCMELAVPASRIVRRNQHCYLPLMATCRYIRYQASSILTRSLALRLEMPRSFQPCWQQLPPAVKYGLSKVILSELPHAQIDLRALSGLKVLIMGGCDRPVTVVQLRAATVRAQVTILSDAVILYTSQWQYGGKFYPLCPPKTKLSLLLATLWQHFTRGKMQMGQVCAPIDTLVIS